LPFLFFCDKHGFRCPAYSADAADNHAAARTIAYTLYCNVVPHACTGLARTSAQKGHPLPRPTHLLPVCPG